MRKTRAPAPFPRSSASYFRNVPIIWNKHINESESNITHLIRFIHESAKDHTISGHPSACGLKIIWCKPWNVLIALVKGNERWPIPSAAYNEIKWKTRGTPIWKWLGMLVVSLRPWKLQILVSLGVFGRESHYILPIQVSRRAVHKKIYKKCHEFCFSMLSF